MPVTGKLMMDLMVTAMACDLTRVGTIQWTDSQAIESLPFLKLNGNALTEAHHGYQHDRGYQPDAIKIIENWYATQFAYLLDRMAATKEADGTSLLDNTLVLWCKEIQHPNSHAQDNMPFVLAGGAHGKLKTGRFLKFSGRSHHDMLSWIQNAFGIDGQSYGLAEFNKGPLPL
jgi:hypothetical protein